MAISEKPKEKKEEKRKVARKAQSDSRSNAQNPINFKQLVLPLVAVIIIVFAFYYVYSQDITTPFPTFLANFNAASRVAIVVNYGNVALNSSVPASESEVTPCATSLVQVISGGGRNPTTIDFFDVNSTSCDYLTGFGTSASQITSTSASQCLTRAIGEPSIFLNYSSQNSTHTTPYHLYIGGNNAYMAKCGVAIDMAS